MTLAITHAFVSLKTDDPVAVTAGKVLPSHWNAGLTTSMASGKILGRSTAGTGAIEELSLSSVLDLVGSAAQGDILIRGASTWTRLGTGTDGQYLTAGGAGANPSWTTFVTADIPDAAVTYAKMQNISATARILGRKTAGAGVTEELTVHDILDMVGSEVQGSVLYRGATNWEVLGAGTDGYVLTAAGAAANPAWEAIPAAVVPTAASTGEIAAQSAVDKYIRPDRISSLPMLPKAWAYVDVSTSGSVFYTTIGGNNLTAGASGSSTIRLSFGTAMADTTYGVILYSEEGDFTPTVINRTTGYLEIGGGKFLGTVVVF